MINSNKPAYNPFPLIVVAIGVMLILGNKKKKK